MATAPTTGTPRVPPQPLTLGDDNTITVRLPDGTTKKYDVVIEAIDAHGNVVDNDGAFKVHEKAQALFQILANELAASDPSLFQSREVVLHAGKLGVDITHEATHKALYETLNEEAYIPEATDLAASHAVFAGDKDAVENVRNLVIGEPLPTKQAVMTAWATLGTELQLDDLPENDDDTLTTEQAAKAFTKLQEFLATQARGADATSWLDVENWAGDNTFTEHLDAECAARDVLADECEAFRGEYTKLSDLWKCIFDGNDAALYTPPAPLPDARDASPAHDGPARAVRARLSPHGDRDTAGPAATMASGFGFADPGTLAGDD